MQKQGLLTVNIGGIIADGMGEKDQEASRRDLESLKAPKDRRKKKDIVNSAVIGGEDYTERLQAYVVHKFNMLYRGSDTEFSSVSPIKIHAKSTNNLLLTGGKLKSEQQKRTRHKQIK